MKSSFFLQWMALPVMLAVALSAYGQNPQRGQGCGRGRGPHAWGDTNKDGICERTGKPVGQCRKEGTAAKRQDCGKGRGMAACGANQPATK